MSSMDGILPQSQPQPVHTPSLAIYRRIATVFILLTLVVVGSVMYFAFSRATIVVLAEQKEVRQDLIIDVSKAPAKGEVAGGIYEMSDTLSKDFQSSTFANAEAHAEGRVLISSRLSRPQTLVATTRLLTAENVLFRLKKTVTVPAEGSVEVDIFADESGTTGDVGHTTFTIPGLHEEVRKLFKVETVAPVSGGIREVRMITDEDVEKAFKELTDGLIKDMNDKLAAKAGNDRVPTSGSNISTEVTRKDIDKKVGDEMEYFSATVTVKATAVFYDESAFDSRVAEAVEGALPEGRVIRSMSVDDRQTSVEKIDLVGGRANIHVFSRGVSVISPEAPALDRTKLAGVTVDAATLYLQKTDGVSSASIKVSPFWSSRLPSDPERIKIDIR